MQLHVLRSEDLQLQLRRRFDLRRARRLCRRRHTQLLWLRDLLAAVRSQPQQHLHAQLRGRRELSYRLRDERRQLQHHQLLGRSGDVSEQRQSVRTSLPLASCAGNALTGDGSRSRSVAVRALAPSSLRTPRDAANRSAATRARSTSRSSGAGDSTARS